MTLHEFLKEHGLSFEPVLDNKIHRCDRAGTKKDDDIWYIGSNVLLPSGKTRITLTVGDHTTGEKWYFPVKNGVAWSEEDRKYYESQAKKAQEIEERDTREKHESAAREAEKVWQSAGPASSEHPYVKRKKIGKDCIGLIKQSAGSLLIPARGIDNSLRGLQFIDDKGNKKFLYGTKKQGSCFKFPRNGSEGFIVLCEGFATGASINEATGFETYISFDAGNLGVVGKYIRGIYPSHRIIIAGDDDRWNSSGKNVGREKATAAAKDVGGVAVFPKFVNTLRNETDFNDVHCLEGLESVRRQIELGIESIETGNGNGEGSLHHGGTDEESGSSNDCNSVPNQSEIRRARGKDSVESTGYIDDTKANEERGELEDDFLEKDKSKLSAREKFREVLQAVIDKSDSSKIPEIVFDKEEKRHARRMIDRMFFTTETPYNMAYSFLKDCDFIDKSGNPLIRYYRDDFYRYKDSYYQKLDDEWLEDRINRWMIANDWKKFAGTAKVEKIFNILRTKPQYVGRQIDLPAVNKSQDWMGDWEHEEGFIPLSNGGLVVSTGKVIPHSPRNFFTYSLPFDYDPNAKCPIYDALLKEIFSCEEEELLWNELMGMAIYNPQQLEKFVLLWGKGANGKSVLAAILSFLLGKNNVSNVPIDCFNPSNFMFIDTLGKLANIVPDMKDIHDIDEGTLKAYISREEVHFNRKGKPAVRAKPTAVVFACTNTLPKFTDKTDGIWRRMVLIEFKKQVKEEKQNPQLKTEKFWIESGELPGIFNRALEGIKRVQDRGTLIEPKSVRAAREEYKNDLNNVSQFMNDCLIFSECDYPSHKIYSAFRNMVIANGGSPMAAKTFFNQLKSDALSKGHKVDVSDKASRFGDLVSKTISGVELNEYGQSFLENDDAGTLFNKGSKYKNFYS